MSDVPEYIIEAEHELWDWGTRSPVDCMEASKNKRAERRLEIFKQELQYHLGAFTAARHTCNALYKIESINDRYYPEPHPPWLKDAVRYKEDLVDQVENAE